MARASETKVNADIPTHGPFFRLEDESATAPLVRLALLALGLTAACVPALVIVLDRLGGF